MKKNKENDLIEVFAGTSMSAGIVKSLLEDSGIEVFLQGEILGTLAPWHNSPGGGSSVKVIISNLDYDKAKLIIDEYNNSLNTN